METLGEFDPEIADIIKNERERQNNTLEMIASENFVSPRVLEAQGSVLTNKYAEGYPGKRYYGGCQFVDQAEELAIKRAKEAFKTDYHVNVQPHSGSQANMAVYLAVLKPGDTIMGLNLSHGGHLTHGSPANFSGQLFKVVFYGVDKETEIINFDDLASLAERTRPKMIVAGASAYPRTLDWEAFRKVADSVGAYLTADIAHIAGLIAADLHPSPFGPCHFVTTTTHKTLRGPRSGLILCQPEYAALVDKAIFPGTQGGPLMHIIAAKAVCFKEALQPSFIEYQQQIVSNAQTLARELSKLNFRLISGGTDTHLMLVDLRNKGITGKEAEEALEKAGITVNRNAVPYDPQPPRITSGLRLGTPALTTRQMNEPEMVTIAHLIGTILSRIEDEKNILEVREKVKDLCARFPLYQY
ncbi:MAG: serine hydroxymethyltransferase [bacterium]